MADDLDQLRAKAMRLVARAEGDPAFAERVRSEPTAVLREAGLPEDLLVPAHERAAMDFWCADFTCWSSECPGTCFVTVPSVVQAQ